ncbi:MAG TPA: acetylxylan esterase [Candidatus Methylacidiphilales bacterium]
MKKKAFPTALMSSRLAIELQRFMKGLFLSKYFAFFLFGLTSLPVRAEAPLLDFWKEATPQELPFAEEWLVEKEEGGLTWKEFYFTSQMVDGTPYRIYAIYAAPTGRSGLPAVLHIHGAGDSADPATVRWWAEHGYAALSFDWMANPGGRKPPGARYSNLGGDTELEPKQFLFAIPPERSRIHISLIAARRALSWLSERPEIDRTRIGVEGVSWGGFQSLILAAIDPRVKATVDVYGMGFFQGTNLNGGCFGLTGPLQSFPKEQQQDWLTHFDPQNYLERIKTPVFLATGTNDMFFWFPLIEKTFTALPGEKALWVEPNVNHSLHFPDRPRLLTQAAGWFNRELLGQGPPPPVLNLEEVSPSRVGFHVKTEPDRIATARINYLWLDKEPVGGSIGVYWNKTSKWEAVPASAEGVAKETWSAPLSQPPVEAQYVTCYATVETTEGLIFSSVAQTVPLSEKKN